MDMGERGGGGREISGGLSVFVDDMGHDQRKGDNG